MYKTNQEIKMVFRSHGLTTIPEGTVCMPISKGSTAGSFWVDDLTWIECPGASMLYHDASHYGIVIPPEYVEES